MKEIKKNNESTGFQGILLNPVTFMDIAYGHNCFYLKRYYPDFDGKRIALGSKIGHAGQGCLPGQTAVLATVDKIDEVKHGLYRYKLKNIDVFEPVEIKRPLPDHTFYLESANLNMLDNPENTEWLENYFYPKIKGAYVNYLGELIVPEPEYV